VTDEQRAGKKCRGEHPFEAARDDASPIDDWFATCFAHYYIRRRVRETETVRSAPSTHPCPGS
jgi:hypothetical protein